MTFVFCQSPNADRWHIRKLVRQMKKAQGQTSLCGRAVKWDLTLPLSINRLALCCPDCAALYAVHEDKGL